MTPSWLQPRVDTRRSRDGEAAVAWPSRWRAQDPTNGRSRQMIAYTRAHPSRRESLVATRSARTGDMPDAQAAESRQAAVVSDRTGPSIGDGAQAACAICTSVSWPPPQGARVLHRTARDRELLALARSGVKVLDRHASGRAVGRQRQRIGQQSPHEQLHGERLGHNAHDLITKVDAK